MTEENTVSWDDALQNQNYVYLEEDTETTVVITDWKLVETHKFDEDMVEFQARVIEHDGKIGDKTFTTTSNRLKAKLRPVLEKKDPTTSVKLSILPVGKNFERQYRVQEVKD